MKIGRMSSILVLSAVVIAVVAVALNISAIGNFKEELLSSGEKLERVEGELKVMNDSVSRLKEEIGARPFIDYAGEFESLKVGLDELASLLAESADSSESAGLVSALVELAENFKALESSLLGYERPENLGALLESFSSLEEKVSTLSGTIEENFGALSEEIASIEPPSAPVAFTADATEGSGVRVRIESGFKGSSILHDGDLLLVLNELYSLGARQISLNDKRILPYTYIRCIGSTVIIDGEPTRITPIVLDVLGDYDYLVSGLGLLSEYFKGREIQFTFLPLEFLTIPAGGG